MKEENLDKIMKEWSGGFGQSFMLKSDDMNGRGRRTMSSKRER
jgi:hypothetical protein